MQAVTDRVEAEIAKLPQAAVMDLGVKEKMLDMKKDALVDVMAKEMVGSHSLSTFHHQKATAISDLSFGADTLFSFMEAKDLSVIAKICI
jgi:hypothetical protein